MTKISWICKIKSFVSDASSPKITVWTTASTGRITARATVRVTCITWPTGRRSCSSWCVRLWRHVPTRLMKSALRMDRRTWTSMGTVSIIMSHIYGRLWLIRSVKFSVFKLTKIVILWVYYTIPYGFSMFWHIWGITFQLLKLLCWLKITDEDSVLEMRIWSILLIKSDLKLLVEVSFYIIDTTNEDIWLVDRDVTLEGDKSHCLLPDVMWYCHVSRHNALRRIMSCFSFRYNKQ